MRVAGYPRVSTEEQAEDGYSIQEQIESIQKWCKDNGHAPAVIEPYIDDGYSAKDLKRPGIKKLIEDVKAKKYDIVITTKLNRLSRKLLDILNLIDLMERNGCSYVSEQEKFDTSTYIGRMQMQMLGVIAEFDRERISEDVRNTMKSIARKSGETKKAFTTPCYGYEVIDGKYVINEKEAEILKLMVNWTLEGEGPYVIAKKLNAMGRKTRQGFDWHTQTIFNTLKKEAISGMLIYNRIYTRNGKRYYRPEEEWIVIEDHHPAIIDSETYKNLRAVLEGRKSGRKQADNDRWLLSGLVKCAHCGSTMKGATSKNRSRKDKSIVLKEYHRYVCTTYQTKGLCFFHYIFREDLEEFIINFIKSAAESADNKKIKVRVAEPRNKDSDRQALLNKLSRLDVRMQKQIEAYEDDLISASDLKKARERIDGERDEIQHALKELDKDEATSGQTKVQNSAKKFLNDVLSDDRLKVKNGIRQIIKEIIVTNGEEIEIVIH